MQVGEEQYSNGQIYLEKCTPCFVCQGCLRRKRKDNERWLRFELEAYNNSTSSYTYTETFDNDGKDRIGFLVIGPFIPFGIFSLFFLGLVITWVKASIVGDGGIGVGIWLSR